MNLARQGGGGHRRRRRDRPLDRAAARGRGRARGCAGHPARDRSEERRAGGRRRLAVVCDVSATAPPSTPRSRASRPSSARSRSWSTTRARSAWTTCGASSRWSRIQREEALNGGVKTPLDALVRLTDEEWRRMLAIHLDGTFYCTRAAVSLHGPARPRRRREHVLDLRPGRLHRAPALLGRQGRDPRLHQGRGQGADRAGHPRQRGRARARRARTRCRARSTRSARRSRTPRRPAAWPSRQEIAATVAFLASDDAGYFVGQILSPNGGLVTA